MSSTMTPQQQKKPVMIRQVWAHNLIYEFSLIQKAIPPTSFVSFDTEFPGTILEPKISPTIKKSLISHDKPDYIYYVMKENVNRLKLVQLGLSLSDSQGNLPSFGTEFCYVWQFNFRDFDLQHDPHKIESIHFLQRQGMDFKKNSEMGIDSRDFAWLLLSSGLVMNCYSSLAWITFHGSYDLGFLIKILMRQNLPDDIESFKDLVQYCLGARVYDVKYMTNCISGLDFGGLERVANSLGVVRVAGNSHQAGSDSLLTLQAFIRLTNRLIKNNQNFNVYEGLLFGLSPRRLQTSCGSQFLNPSNGHEETANGVKVMEP